jgi:hypothetical protein
MQSRHFGLSTLLANIFSFLQATKKMRETRTGYFCEFSASHKLWEERVQ